jgi:hypothetical protein
MLLKDFKDVCYFNPFNRNAATVNLIYINQIKCNMQVFDSKLNEIGNVATTISTSTMFDSTTSVQTAMLT